MATAKTPTPEPVELGKLNADAAKAGAAACRQSNGKARATGRLADAGADK
jgi:hypothetical protein